MILGLDHVALVVRGLGTAADAYGRLFGLPAPSPVFAPGALRMRFQLGNVALELLSPEGEGGLAPALDAALGQGDAAFWALGFSCEDLGEAARRLERRAVACTPGPDGRLHAERAATGGLGLVFLPAGREAPPPAQGPVVGLDHVVINTSQPERAAALYGARLGLDLRLDRSNPSWGVRQLFFAAGGPVVEVVAPLEPRAELQAADQFGGLAWRVADIEAAHADLTGRGLELSDARRGRKPGTHVLTVRSGLPCGPALLISQSPPADAGAGAA